MGRRYSNVGYLCTHYENILGDMRRIALLSDSVVLTNRGNSLWGTSFCNFVNAIFVFTRRETVDFNTEKITIINIVFLIDT